MARYLSPEWLDRFDRAVQASAAASEASRGARLVIDQVVTDPAGDDVVYHVVVDDGSVRVRSGHAPLADVTIRQDLGTAREVSEGTLSAQAAFMVGRLHVRGDVDALVRHQAAFRCLDGALDELRAHTEY